MVFDLFNAMIIKAQIRELSGPESYLMVPPSHGRDEDISQGGIKYLVPSQLHSLLQKWKQGWNPSEPVPFSDLWCYLDLLSNTR